MSKWCYSLLGFFCCLSFCFGIESQQWQASWKKEPITAWLGLPFSLTLVSVNGPNDMNLQIEQQSNWKIESQRVQTVKGKTPTTIFRLNCIALKSGDLPLPRIELQSQQGVIEVPEKSIPIQSPEVHSGSRLQIDYSKTEVYEKEAIVVKAKWTTTLPLDAIKALKWVIPALEHPSLRVVEIHQQNPPEESRSIGLPIGQRRIIGTWKTEFLEAKEANTLTFEILIQPKVAGEIDLNPSFLVCSVEKSLDKYKNKKWRGNRYPSYFNNNFFEGTHAGESMTRMIVLSKGQKLKVKKLPPSPSRQGETIVGYADLKLKAEPLELQVGDPMHLEITVAHPRPELFELPALSSMEAFERNFKTPQDRSPASYNKKGEKVYKQTLWPKRSDLSMVPPIVLNCFDPESGFYREVTSNSVPIHVKGGESSAFDLAEFAGNLVIKSSVEQDPEGVWHHVWNAEHQPEFKQGSPWMFRVIAIVLALLVIGAQFGPNAMKAFTQMRYDSYGQKAKRFMSDLYDWRSQSNDRKRLRNLVLEHLSGHLKQPKGRYDELYLLGLLKTSGIDAVTYDRLVEWLNEQEKAFASQSLKIEEGEIKTIVLQIFQRRVA